MLRNRFENSSESRDGSEENKIGFNPIIQSSKIFFV